MSRLIAAGLELPDYPAYKVQVKYATEHRCGLVIKGPGLTDAITGTDPLKDNLPLVHCQVTDNSPEAEHTAKLVNYVSDRIRERLRDHPINAARRAEGKNPANVVLMRGCGVRLKLEDFHQRHGLRACIVAPTKILGGLGMTLGMEWIQVPGTTGSYDSQFHLKAAAICDAVCARGFQFGFVHVKAVDDTGHDRLWQMRVRYLEVMDRLAQQIVARLWRAEQEQPSVKFHVIVTGDHSTPVMFGDHSHEPVLLTVAPVASIVAALGRDIIENTDLGPLPAYSQHMTVATEELLAQADAAAQRRAEALEGKAWRAGCWGRLPWVTDTSGDAVRFFDEISAAQGGLGRFPSSELMPLLKQMLRVQ